jgi:hypothetical protein
MAAPSIAGLDMRIKMRIAQCTGIEIFKKQKWVIGRGKDKIVILS